MDRRLSQPEFPWYGPRAMTKRSTAALPLFFASTLGLASACQDKAPKAPPVPSPTAATTQPASASAPSSAPTAAAPAPAAPAAASAVDGKRLFESACANCHGLDGSGSMMRQAMPKIGDLSSPATHARLSDDDIATTIAEGRGKMPPFKSIYQAAQIRAVVEYVRTLKR